MGASCACDLLLVDPPLIPHLVDFHPDRIAYILYSMDRLARSHNTLSALFLLAGILLTACTAVDIRDSVTSSLAPGASDESDPAKSCLVTEPLWVKPPDDSAVQGSPAYGYYFVNEDRSIWASSWWTGQEEYPLRVSDRGVKVGWFRPAGAVLEITGRRLDGQSPPFEVHVPCCYPTRFQATGLIFPVEGCWQVSAKAEDKELSFVVWVEP